jgi:hypothetical protein
MPFETESHAAAINCNRAIYHWDWYLLHGEIDHLIAANAFMLEYRRLGGTEYVETEKAIHASVAHHVLRNQGIQAR